MSKVSFHKSESYLPDAELHDPLHVSVVPKTQEFVTEINSGVKIAEDSYPTLLKKTGSLFFSTQNVAKIACKDDCFQ